MMRVLFAVAMCVALASAEPPTKVALDPAGPGVPAAKIDLSVLPKQKVDDKK